MADMRAHRRRVAQRVLYRSRLEAEWQRGYYTDEMGEDHYFHDDDSEVHDRTCRECGGSGRDEWNDGILPCEHCDGEGYEWWKCAYQT